MKIIDLPIKVLMEAPWNANVMDETTMARLRTSIKRYGMLGNLVVRPVADNAYEVLSGNHRLKVLLELGAETVPCVVVNLGDAHARLVSQALNRIHGDDDLGLRAELVRSVLETIGEEELIALLPETAGSIKALGAMGVETMAGYLQAWQGSQAARLKHLQFQLTASELAVVHEAIARITPQAHRTERDNPNLRGRALYLLCKSYLERKDSND
jgi:ParB family chromosome partitioning protein